ncbi:uncharacterized protein LOC111880493 [Lactuca sativa]|uniref:uncharacterized protein LOC111880493 n=1 Tax=Lactuca sativa TaxID=4236 RepID=UPI000CD855B0|nr:uncharacterized protein LOC111880493 [Lactuca sativa]
MGPPHRTSRGNAQQNQLRDTLLEQVFSKGIIGSDVIRRNQTEIGWESDFQIDDQFCVTALRMRIDRATHMIPDGVFQWSKWIPNKVNCFIWRARMDRIPTAVALDQRGVHVHSTQCSACVSGMESADHLLLKCPFAADLWNRIWEWCGITPMIFPSIKEMLTYIAMTWKCPNRRSTLLSVIEGTMGYMASEER